jgi:tRNA (cytidine/uridine-2'-O-)-methyltransferase
LDAHPPETPLYYLSAKAEKSLWDVDFPAQAILVFGSETKGIEAALLKEKFLSSHFVKLPQFSPHIRSLNLANAATAAAYEVLRQLGKY